MAARPSVVPQRLAVIVGAASVITAIMIGVRITFGLYLQPVIDSIGTDRGTFALAIAIQNLLWGLTQPFSGAIADRYGTARVLVVGAVGYTLSMLLMATADSAGLLILSAGFLVGLSTGAASFAVVLSAVGRLVPPARRSMALGIVTAMGSVGQFLLVPLAQSLLNAYDWRRTITIISFLVLAVVVFARPFRGRSVDHLAQADERARASAPPGLAATAVDPDSGYSLGQELRRAARHRSYVMLNMAFFVCGFHVTFIGTHLPSYVSDLGIDSSVAATALALIGLFNIFGSLTAGALGGRFEKTKLLSAIYASRAIVIALYVAVPATAATTMAFGAAFGLLWLSTVPLTSGIVTSQFGTRHSGALFGIVFLAHQLGAFVGVWLGGELADATGSYRVVWFLALALGVFAALLHLLIDEGPAPMLPVAADRPIGLPTPRIAPGGAVASLGGLTGLAMVVLAAIGFAFTAGSPASATEHSTPTSTSTPTPTPTGTGTGATASVLFCPIHL